VTSESSTGKKSVALALPGGGSHGAFTWGVLDALLEDGRLIVEAITATSAGDMNAVAFADGLAEGGPAGAREKLASLWHEVSRMEALFGLFWAPLDRFAQAIGLPPEYMPSHAAVHALTHSLRLVAGARYSKDRKSAKDAFNGGGLTIPAAPFERTVDYSQATWKLGVDWDLSFIASHKVKLGTTLRWQDRFSLTPQVLWIGDTTNGRKDTRNAPARLETPGYALTNLHLGWHRLFEGRVTLWLDVYNLFDKRHYAAHGAGSRTFFNMPQQPRSWMASVEYRF